MNNGLAFWSEGAASGDVRIEVAEKERGLEKDPGLGRPNRRRTSEPRKN